MKSIFEFLIGKGVKTVKTEPEPEPQKQEPKDNGYKEPPMSYADAHAKMGRATREISTKMDAWHNGNRKENLKACSDAKIICNYKYCERNGYTYEMRQLEREANRRGWTLTKLN